MSISRNQYYQDDNANVFIFLALLLFWICAVGGWIANVAKIWMTAGDPMTGFFIARCIGVFFAPVGVVLGYL